MIISTIVIWSQLNFSQTKDIGFEKDHLMVIDINSGNVRKQFKTMKNEYSNIPGVESVAVSTRVPGEWKNIDELYVSSSNSSDGVPDSIKTFYMGFDEDMLDTYRINLVEGRNFSVSSQADSTSVLLNRRNFSSRRTYCPYDRADYSELPVDKGCARQSAELIATGINRVLHKRNAYIKSFVSPDLF